jgi:hypothetical protein
LEKFYESQIRKLIALIRDRSPDADAQLQFCIEWGGGPLGAAALVAQAWLQDRAGCTDQASGQLCLGDEVHPHRGVPWDPVEPLPSTSAPEPLGRTSASKRSSPPTATTPEPPKRKASPDWVKAALAQKAQR